MNSLEQFVSKLTIRLFLLDAMKLGTHVLSALQNVIRLTLEYTFADVRVCNNLRIIAITNGKISDLLIVLKHFLKNVAWMDTEYTKYGISINFHFGRQNFLPETQRNLKKSLPPNR